MYSAYLKSETDAVFIINGIKYIRKDQVVQFSFKYRLSQGFTILAAKK